MEQKANDIVQTYVQLYYDFATASVYFNDTDTQGFNACFLVQKIMDTTTEVKSGTWDAIHVVICNMKELPKVKYQVISTVMVSLEMEQPNGVGSMQIHGSSSKQALEYVTLPENFGASRDDPDLFHLERIGKLIESNEEILRQNVQDSYINKQRQITNTGRLMEEYMTHHEKARFQELAARGEILGKTAQASANEEIIR